LDVYTVTPPAPVREGEQAAVLCQVSYGPLGCDRNQYYYGFATAEAAMKFAAQPRCPNPECAGCHIVAFRRDRAIHTAVLHHRRRQLSLAELLDELYPRSALPTAVEYLPTPLEYNPPLEPRGKVQCAL
jgi:hypothetical protein